MKRLLRFVSMCFGALVLMLSAVIFATRGWYQIKSLPELHSCDKGMCLFDIAPNKTTISDAQKIIRDTQSFQVTRYSDKSAFKQSQPYYRVDLFESIRDCNTSALKCVGEIDLVFLNQNGLTAGQIVAEFGSPCAILPFFPSHTMSLVYPGMVLFFLPDQQSDSIRFQPNLPLGQINVFKNAETCAEVANKSKEYYPWRGFSLYYK